MIDTYEFSFNREIVEVFIEDYSEQVQVLDLSLTSICNFECSLEAVHDFIALLLLA
jgi:hypothetical protein